ncbi:unnamed protein product [Arctia plantaginis]|uniref:N-acetyltransferase domain-containing protein n=1 Tax=Arctia plantaginis TaxID=874455 RepID=A0A8S0ZAN6_ARCPL|nr:unnamed protein product [Arctia plantaginis]
MTQSLKIWSKFSTTKESGTLNFQIVEAPKDRIEDVAELIVNHFMTGEAISKAAGISKSDESIAEYKQLLLELLQDKDKHIVICCLDNDNGTVGEIIGASLMRLITKDKPEELKVQLKSKELQKLVDILKGLEEMYDMISEQGVEKFYDDRGVVVHPNYRRCGICYELVKTRRLICQKLGVPLTAALMTAYATQKAAERDGWETVFEYNFEEIGKLFNVTFDKNDPPIAKLMVARA